MNLSGTARGQYLLTISVSANAVNGSKVICELLTRDTARVNVISLGS